MYEGIVNVLRDYGFFFHSGSANILLDEKFVAKISDFGLTRASAKHTSSTVMTEKVVGTTAYMAPEALRGEITPKSDIYSFGVVLLPYLLFASVQTKIHVCLRRDLLRITTDLVP